MNYPVGDFLIRIKNASLAKRKAVIVRNTKFIKAVADTLVAAGFLTEAKLDGTDLHVGLRYVQKEPVVMDISLVSKPGLRIYIDADTLASRRSPAILIVSTPKGVMTSKEAIKQRVGGEVIAEVL